MTLLIADAGSDGETRPSGSALCDKPRHEPWAVGPTASPVAELSAYEYLIWSASGHSYSPWARCTRSLCRAGWCLPNRSARHDPGPARDSARPPRGQWGSGPRLDAVTEPMRLDGLHGHGRAVVI